MVSKKSKPPTGLAREQLIRKVVLWEYKDPSVWLPEDGDDTVKGKFKSESGLRSHVTYEGWNLDALRLDPAYAAIRDELLFSRAVPWESLQTILEALFTEATTGSVAAMKEILAIRREIEGRRSEAWVDPLDVSAYDPDELWGALQLEARQRGYDVFLVKLPYAGKNRTKASKRKPWEGREAIVASSELSRPGD